jgi:hypothetical protein
MVIKIDCDKANDDNPGVGFNELFIRNISNIIIPKIIITYPEIYALIEISPEENIPTINAIIPATRNALYTLEYQSVIYNII